MNIDRRLVPVLQKIDFANRYKLLCEMHSNFRDRLTNFDNAIIKEFCEGKGLRIDYVKNENFFRLIESVASYKVQFNIIPHNGFLQFVFSIRLGNETVKMGWGMWESITRELVNIETKKPLFTSLDELEEILSEACSIYEDFKRELSKIGESGTLQQA